jgi:AAA domain/DnaB-like helicase N terminal domain
MTVMDDVQHLQPAGDDRQPPHSVEAEQAVLGALWMDNRAFSQVSDLIDSSSLWFDQHKLLWDATCAIIREGQPADELTVHARLQAQGLADRAGGLAYICEIQAGTLSARNVRRYAEIVAEHYAERELITACAEAVTASWQTGNKLGDRLDRINGLLSRAEGLRKGVSARVPLLKLSQLRDVAQQVRWTVKHVIPAASVGMLFGGSGTFKSFIALDAALHVVHGLPWMGRITRKAPVLYVAAEGGAGLWMRIHAWHKSRGLRWGDVPFYVVPVALDLAQDAWRIVEAAQALGVSPGMVIVDTLSQTYAGEENSANEMAAYLRELGARFRDLWQCTVLLVHHTGHQATERPRGSSAIRSNIDFLLGVFRDEKEMLATVTSVKQKDGEIQGDAVFSLAVVDLGFDDDNDKITSLVARHLSTPEEIEQARHTEQAAGRGGRNSAFMALVCNGMDERALRKAFYELLEGLDSEAKKKAFFRAKTAAIDGGLIEITQGLVIDLRPGA